MNKSMYNKILAVASLREFDLLRKLYNDLLIDRDDMDAFFDRFLETNKLDRTPKTSPVWITYDKKYAEYSELVSNIKTAEYYLRNNNVI